MTKKASFRKNRMYLNRIENNYIKLYLQIFIAVSFLVRSNAVIRGHPRPGWSESGRPHSAVKQVINTVSDPVKRNHKLGPTSGSAPVEHRPAVNRHQIVSVEWYWFCVNPVCIRVSWYKVPFVFQKDVDIVYIREVHWIRSWIKIKPVGFLSLSLSSSISLPLFFNSKRIATTFDILNNIYYIYFINHIYFLYWTILTCSWL